MDALVAYGSSDEDDDDIEAERRPAKMAKTDADAPASITHMNGDIRQQKPEAPQPPAPIPPHSIPPETCTPTAVDSPAPGPAAGPLYAVGAPEHHVFPFDPHAFERQRLRELTMPTVPNFDIPDSPPPPPPNSEEAAVLAATTNKLERFLDLKRAGVHFNERLQNSASLRNPSLLPKLMDFAGITQEESYASSLSEEVAVPVKWPEDCYIEGLMKQNARKEKKRRLQERAKVEFVPARNGGSSSVADMPGGDAAAAAAAAGGGLKKGKFDIRSTVRSIRSPHQGAAEGAESLQDIDRLRHSMRK